MTTTQKQLSTWILVISGLFAIMELLVSISLWFMPESIVENVDLNAKGVDYVIQMWATRQFALGVIFAYATFKKSVAMLTLAYVFFLAMFVGDFLIGITQQENALMISALVMCGISSVMLYFVNKGK